ncbi:hypothetical protein [Nocardia huaxiensis]|uniref:Uncharacterized protein n=1 Tax=Nocardia huaxiensis TaxID=2755382 RepID=A0A7D6ZB14_9NOCA|nr:hypothetical protein [Nocardia huaxiensis]QLY31308.1 hypothetical protein H0264_02790 [Nocardia huaxiensis]UFS94851.1 hypothetical protein LPY97_29625 [Nocardia huaxiensis]
MKKTIAALAISASALLPAGFASAEGITLTDAADGTTGSASTGSGAGVYALCMAANAALGLSTASGGAPENMPPHPCETLSAGVSR